jgi:hypothetical protein
MVYTGASEANTKQATSQIEQTFVASQKFKVGCKKLDHLGQVVPGVTAVSVKDIFPLQHANLLKLCVVINDDDLS